MLPDLREEGQAIIDDSEPISYFPIRGIDVPFVVGESPDRDKARLGEQSHASRLSAVH